MSQSEPLIRNISDTARWAAVYRAHETERDDALFRDPFARRLAGERGEQIAATLSFGGKEEWTWLTRTYLFDQFITDQIRQGVDMVINLAAGLDARPYRMALFPSLKWIEIDLPEILAYKEKVLVNEKPMCSLERIRLDLSNVDARREVFAQLNKRANKVLIMSEGLLIYLKAEAVGSLAQDLAASRSFRRWIIDLVSPGLLLMLRKKVGSQLTQAGAPFEFAPEEGPEFFAHHGWKPVDVRSYLKTAAKLKRLPFLLRLAAMLPEKRGPQGSRIWAGVCLLARQ